MYSAFTRTLTATLLALLLIAGVLPAAGAAGSPFTLAFARPLPTGNSLYGLTRFNNWFVAVGRLGTVLTSADGLAWTRRSTGSTADLRSVATDGKRLVAVGAGGTVLISTDDAGTWRSVSAGTAQDLLSVTFASGRFVAVGKALTIATSVDGEQWAVRQTGGDVDLTGVAYGQGRYVAVGQIGSIYTSADGLTWTDQSLPRPVDLRGIAFGGGRFVAAGHFDQWVTSAGGAQWTIHSGYAGFDTVLYDGLKFVAAGFSGIFLSETGEKWENHRVVGESGFNALAFDGRRYVAVGENGLLVTSEDGRTWKIRNGAHPTSVGQVVYGNGRFLTEISYDLTGSADGRTWTVAASEFSADSYAPFQFVNGRFLTQDWNKNLMVSLDGHTWEKTGSPGVLLSALAFGGGRYVGVGSQGTLVTATDLGRWSFITSPTQADLTGVAYGNGRFVAVGTKNTVLLSADGIQWKPVQVGRGVEVPLRLAYGNGLFVAVGGRGRVLTSPDGETWTRRPAPTMADLKAVAVAGDRFVAVGGYGTVLTSGDGISWWPAPQVTTRELFSVAYGNGQVVITGDGGTILTGTGDMPGAPCGTVFTDVPAQHPACLAVERLAARRVIGGFPDGTFRPDQRLTRAELAKLLVLSREYRPTRDEPLPFADVAGHWAAAQGYLQTTVRLKAFSGFPDGTFRPDEPVTRAQLVKVASAGISAGAPAPYSDVPRDAWHHGAVSAAYRRLIGPDAPVPLWTGDLLEPDRPATRAEAAVILSNLMDN